MKRLPFKDMAFVRNSDAWCPVTGTHVEVNAPRVVEDFALECIKDPITYYDFPTTQGFTAYDRAGYTRPGETTDYYVDLANALETISAAPTRLLLGTSYEGRNLDAFRLGPADRQHFLISSVVHGNEVDGLTGTFKAIEILMTHPDFQTLRDNFTIMFMPNCNPDGHYAGTRMLTKMGPHPSGVNQAVNLNRQWPWFWAEYQPGDTESKGTVALNSPEATAMYDYITTGNGGAAVPVRFLLDQHATVGDGTRYQSRDKNYRNYDEYSWFDIWADWVIWKHLRATQAKRIQADPTLPDLWVNYYRSRFNPHWHSWMATRSKADNGGASIISVISEHNTVGYMDTRRDSISYRSACTFNMDYILSCAQVMQGGVVTPRDAVLVEHEVGNNQVQNSNFDQWNKKSSALDDIEYRPSYWKPARGSLVAYDQEAKHMDYHGQCYTFAPDLIVELPAGQNAGPENYHDIQRSLDGASRAIVVANITAGGSAFHEWGQEDLSGELITIFEDAALPNDNEKRIAGGQLSKIALLDMGNTGDNLKLITYESSASYVRNLRVTYAEPRIGAATAYDGSDTTYIIGGFSTVLEKTILQADRTAHTITELGTNLLTTADADAEAIYCSGGTLAGMVIAIGGRTLVTDRLRLVVIDPTTPSASETLLDVSGETLPSALIRFGLEYDGVSKITIYGGENPSDSSIHRGVWSLTWSGSAWSVAEVSLVSGVNDDADPVDYSGEAVWEDLWSRWRAATLIAADEGTRQVVLFGGVQEDVDTGLPIVTDYNRFYVHDVLDGDIHRPQTQTYGYVRYNSAFTPAGAYTMLSTTWSAKSHPDSTASYMRINNAPGDSITGDLTTRYVRTYYQCPPTWWMRNSATIDLGIARPDRTEDQWRCYFRCYRNDEKMYMDSPMVQVGTLWPSSWSPYGMSRGVETATWAASVDPRRLRAKFVWTPSASFLCLTASIRLLSIDDGTRKLELWALSGDRTERAFKRDYNYSNSEQELEFRVYDSVGAYTSCKLPVYWGGLPKDVANDRFDSPLTVEIWAHPEHGHGFLVNNTGATGKNSLLGKFLASAWSSTADINIAGGGWWSEPDIYTIDEDWILDNKVPNTNGALLMGDRDPTFGLVDPKSAFRYTEEFDRADDANLGSRWDIIQQTGAGFNILSQRAVCTTVGWERWDAEPNIRDCHILGTIKINNHTCRAGFFSRMSWGMASNGDVHGYLGSLNVDAALNPTLVIERFYISGGVQQRTTLGTASCAYTLGDDIKIKFSTVGSTLTMATVTALDVVIDSVVVTDAVNNLPGVFGICGETPGASSSIEFDDVYADPDSTVKMRITD